METTVTQAASVAADFDLPSPGTTGYDEWRKSGKIPDAKEVKQEEEGKTQVQEQETEPSEAESATAKAVTRSDSASGKPQGIKKKGDDRFRELANDNRELRARLAALETKGSTPAEKRETVESQPTTAKAESDEPELGGINPKTGKAFATVAEWQKEHTAWLRGQILSEVRTDQTKAEQQREQDNERKKQDRKLFDKFDEAKEKYPDFDKVAFNHDLTLPLGSPADIFIRNSENPAELLYHLGKNPEILNGFYRYVPGNDDKPGKLTGQFFDRIHPNMQMIELAKIEASISVPKTTKAPAQSVTQAPRPPHQVSGKAAPPDQLAKAVDEGDFASYQRLENEKILAAKKASRR